MSSLKLYMLLLGCKPNGRNTEQHDVFFGVGETLKDLVPAIKACWSEAKGNLHVDAWRAVTQVEGHEVVVSKTDESSIPKNGSGLFFINLGGYKKNEFEEFHYRMIVAAADKGEAIRTSKQTAFYKHTGFPGATSHVDDKYGIDVDDVYEIADILPAHFKEQYKLSLMPGAGDKPDEIHLGYSKLDKL